MSYDQNAAFVRVPHWWLSTEGLDGPLLGLLVTLASYTRGDKPTCFPEQSTLADRVGRSRSWVNGAIATLCELGLVQKSARYRQNRGQSSNLYRIVFTKDQAAQSLNQQCDNSLSQETTPPVVVDDTNKNKDKSTHSDFDLDAWRPEAETLSWIERKIGAEQARLYVTRFVQRCKKQYHYRLEEMDLALRKWFNQDAESWAVRAAGGSAQRRKAGVSVVPTKTRPDDRVSLTSGPDEVEEVGGAVRAVALAVQQGSEVSEGTSDPVRFAGACATFLASRGRGVYHAWIATLEFAGLQDGKIMVRAKSRHQASYVTQTYGSELAQACRRAGLMFDRLEVL